MKVNGRERAKRGGKDEPDQRFAHALSKGRGKRPEKNLRKHGPMRPSLEPLSSPRPPKTTALYV